MSTITDGAWWKAAAIRAFRTAAVVAVPYTPVALSGADYLILASAFGMGFVLSILTSLAGIAEAEGSEQPWWYATVSRVTKTVAQALITAVGSAALFTEVDWSVIPALVVSSAVGSLLLAVVKQLPEAPTPTAVTPVEIAAVAPVALDTPVITTNVVVVSDEDAAKAVADKAEKVYTDYHGI